MKNKIAILTNLISPYRVPLFSGVGSRFLTTVAVGIQESNRPEWNHVDQDLEASGVHVRQLSGLMLKRSEDQFFHVNPGYLSFLFRETPDGVISFELGFRTLCAIIFAKVRRRPLWIWSEGTIESENGISSLKHTLRKQFVRAKSRWITLGRGSTDYLLSLGVTPDRIVQLQNGVDEKMFTAVGTAVEKIYATPVILVVGQLIERKGLELLLCSAKRLQDQGAVFTLRFVGSGPRLEALETQVRTLALDNVQFVGWIDPELLPAEYRAADAMIFPTLKDVWGLVANEALLCGLPVICSRYAGCATELVGPSDIFDPLEPNDLDRALLKAVKGEVGKPDLERIWPMSKIVGTLCDDIDRIMDGTRN